MPWRLCDLPKHLPPSTITVIGSAPFPSLRSGISGHRSGSHARALLSDAPSPETLIPLLSLALPRLPSHVPSNTCCVRPLPSLPSSYPGTRTSVAHGIGGGGDDDDDDQQESSRHSHRARVPASELTP